MSNIVTVDFRNDTLFAIERDDGVFVAIKPIVQTLGLDWKAQHRRINDDPILREGMVTTTMPSVGGAQETTRYYGATATSGLTDSPHLTGGGS